MARIGDGSSLFPMVDARELAWLSALEMREVDRIMGGGMVAARHLADRGVDVRVVRAAPDTELGEVQRHQLETLGRMRPGVSHV